MPVLIGTRWRRRQPQNLAPPSITPNRCDRRKEPRRTETATSERGVSRVPLRASIACAPDAGQASLTLRYLGSARPFGSDLGFPSVWEKDFVEWGLYPLSITERYGATAPALFYCGRRGGQPKAHAKVRQRAARPPCSATCSAIARSGGSRSVSRPTAIRSPHLAAELSRAVDAHEHP